MDDDSKSHEPKRRQSGGRLIPRVFSRSSDKDKKMPLRESRPMQEQRRALRPYNIIGPNYKVDAQVLIDSYIEKEIKYLGQIPKIPADLDPTKRTDILRVIDEGKVHSLIPWKTDGPELDAILSISANNVKVLRRDGEELLYRASIHEIASLSYVRDDGQHLIGCKVASKENVNDLKLIVFQCHSKAAAEEVCSLLRQTFELVYTELTMSFLDYSIHQGAARFHSLRSYASLASRPGLDDWIGLPPRNRPGHERRPSEGDLSISAKQMLQEYIELLRTKLTSEELQRFAVVLREYREGMAVEQFCSRLQRLYGQERVYLFPGLLPFIPEKDGDYFDSFLERMGIHEGNGLVHSSGRPYARTMSETSSSTLGAAENGVYSHSIPSEIDEFDRMMSEICNDIDSLESSIDN